MPDPQTIALSANPQQPKLARLAAGAGIFVGRAGSLRETVSPIIERPGEKKESGPVRAFLCPKAAYLLVRGITLIPQAVPQKGRT